MKQCIISDGCHIQTGAQIERSLIGVRSRIGRNVTIRDSVLIGADRYETDAEREANRIRGIPNLTLDHFTNLFLVDYARKVNAGYILRGIRNPNERP